MTVRKEPEHTFTQKVWIVAGIASFTVVMLLILKSIFSVLMLVFLGAIIAIYFKALAGLIHTKLKIPEKLSLPLSIIGSLLLLLLFFFFAGKRIQVEVQQLSDTLPSAFENFKAKMSESVVGRRLLEKASSQDTMDKAGGFFSSFFRGTFGVIGDVYVILLVAIFLTASPQQYTKGIVRLVPPDGKKRAADVLKKIGESLRKWLKGQITACVFIFILSAIALLIIGVPMWLVLALFAGLMNFIPNFGPLIALIPAVLVGLMDSVTTAVIIGITYTVIQILESSLITPQIQQKLLSIPPAILIIMQVLMSVLLGVLGLLIATPLLVVLMVVVQELYVKKQGEAA